uniref:Ig-like domain-containing protein n=1 Tax=Leptobrachium leishanense TaxID=445787 RepID=A0A8C5MDC5_9ANUR
MSPETKSDHPQLTLAMEMFLWLLCVTTTATSVLSQLSFSESGPSSVRPGETMMLTCKVTGGSLTDKSTIWSVQWVRQPAGKGLEWMGGIWHDNIARYATSMQGRLTVSRDTNKGEVYVKLTGVKPEDTCVYYCARESQRDT